MNRRELLKMISALTGTAMVGGSALLSGCATSDSVSAPQTLVLGASDLGLLDEIAETILPRTQVPGAKDAETGRQMMVMVNNCYSKEEQETFHRGLSQLQQRSSDRFGADFMAITAQQRHELLVQLDSEAKEHAQSGAGAHYFTMFKQLTLFCYFTSEVAATQAMRFIAVPGRYDGCAPYEKGEPAWAVSS